jgi:hypothetical protein
MEIPCDTIGQAVADYLDAGDFTTASRTTYRRSMSPTSTSPTAAPA